MQTITNIIFSSYFVLWCLLFALLGTILYAFLVLYSHYNFLKNNDLDIDNDYDAMGIFFSTSESLLKFSLRRVVKVRKLFSHYIVLSILKSIDFVQSLMQRFYEFMRGYFVKKSIENKSLVVHFWDHLKHYKKEIDSEDK